MSVLDSERILQCPGCEAWQLHVPLEVSLAEKPWELEEVIEAMLRKHVARQCPHPRLVLEMFKAGSRRLV